MNYQDIYNLKQSLSLRQRTRVAIAKSAVYVIGGGAINGNPPTATQFQNAKQALAELDGAQVDRFLWALVMNPDVQAAGEATTDVLIQYVVDSCFATIWAV